MGSLPEKCVVVDWFDYVKVDDPGATNTGRQHLSIPDITKGLSVLDAALAYAQAGWYVLPTDPAVNVKSPGSVVGRGWPEQSSRSPEQIRRWFEKNPHYGIALHCGRSGAGVFDADIDSLEQIARDGRQDLAEALRSAGVIQGTRRSGDRGHYLFLLPEDGREYGNSAGAFMRWGQFRGKNGVIIVAPTPHPDADSKGGHYHWAKAGVVGPMPDALRDCLSEASEGKEPLTDAEVERFLDRYTGAGCGRDGCRHKIDGPIKSFNKSVDDGGSRYESLVSVMPWAFSETMAGCYSARDLADALWTAYSTRFGPKEGFRLGRIAGEFQRVLQWATAQAYSERAHRNDADGLPKKRNQQTLLVDLALEKYKFGVSPDGNAFAFSPATPHAAMDLKGEKFGLEKQLAADFYQKYDVAPSSGSLRSALNVIEGMARQGQPTPLHLRVAGDSSAIHIDMADAANRVIEISGGTWRIVNSSPHMFRRTEVTALMAEPTRAGDVNRLWTFMNVPESDWPLMLAVLVDALIQPDTPKPITLLQAEHGSAKTSCARFMMSLIDPSTTGEPDGPPTSPENWIIVANASWVVALDNLSAIPVWLSDAICRASTGAGAKRRELYTTHGVAVYVLKKAVILTGIDMGGLNGDLTDRMAPVQLKRLTEVKAESRLLAEWDAERANIFGGLLDLAAAVHAKLPTLGDRELPRMADFSRVLLCVDELLGTNGMATYRQRTKRAMFDSAVSDPFMELLMDIKFTSEEGGETAAKILAKVAQTRAGGDPKEWPASARSVTALLRKNAPALRLAGWSVSEDGGSNKSGTVKWTIKPPSDGEIGGESDEDGGGSAG